MADKVVLDGELSLTNVIDGQGGVYSRYDWRGYSAYEIAVQHGYTGTEEEWLVSLHGADGTDGTDGQDGDDYVITEQDYQNIANLVPVPDVPVEDVQINGTSILSNGVANIPLPKTVAVTGTAPTITAQADTRYVCGEVASLDFTPPASGICDVIFTSGSTPTVLTVPSTVKWANGFDPTSLDADTTYELNIMDGLGVAGAWT